MRPLFIGGCPRSGTTLFADLLGSHSAVLPVPEAYFKFAERSGHAHTREALLAHPSFPLWGVEPAPEAGRPLDGAPAVRDVTLAAAQAYAAEAGVDGASWFVDHTPENLKYASRLLEAFPDARFLHLVRDGRAVAASVLRLDWGPSDIISAAQWWLAAIGFGLAAEQALGPERVRRVHFEALVTEPEATLRGLCDWLGLPFEPRMVQGGGYRLTRFERKSHEAVGTPPQPARIVAWRERLTPRQVELFEHRTGDVLPLLGYEPVYGGEARRASGAEALLRIARGRGRGILLNRLRFLQRYREGLRDARKGSASGAERG